MAPQSRTKGEVRRLLRARRRELAASRDLAADAAAMATALNAAPPPGWPAREASTVLSYESHPHEPPTTVLNATLQQQGHRVLVPVTLPDMRLDWCDLADPGRTPLGVATPTTADLVLAPGLAVDGSGTRMGQGGGCYDRVLPMLAAGTPVVVLLHPGEHTLAPLPHDAHDIPVAWVLTADGCTPTDRPL